MNKEDFQRLAKETGIKETTLRARWAKGWRGKELT